MKILVTGAAGYVGSVLCAQEQHNHEIIAVDKGVNGCRSLLGLNVRFYNLDLVKKSDFYTLRDLCTEADAIIHLAALVGVPACDKDPAQSDISNIMASERIGYLSYGKRTIFSSTTSVYGQVKDVCTEDSELSPLSVYARDKLVAEKEMDRVGATIFRFATAFGVSPSLRLNLLPNELVYRAMRDRAILVYEPEAKRNFIHVKDMAKILITAATTDKFRNGIYNVGSVNATKGELAEMIGRLTKCDVVYKNYMTDPEKRDYNMDYSKLLSVYDGPFIGLEEGLKELVQQMPMILCEEAFL